MANLVQSFSSIIHAGRAKIWYRAPTGIDKQKVEIKHMIQQKGDIVLYHSFFLFCFFFFLTPTFWKWASCRTLSFPWMLMMKMTISCYSCQILVYPRWMPWSGLPGVPSIFASSIDVLLEFHFPCKLSLRGRQRPWSCWVHQNNEEKSVSRVPLRIISIPRYEITWTSAQLETRFQTNSFYMLQLLRQLQINSAFLRKMKKTICERYWSPNPCKKIFILYVELFHGPWRAITCKD